MSRVSDAHRALEYLLSQALINNKVGEMTISIPYYELEQKPTDYEPIYLVLTIKTQWDDSEMPTAFQVEQEQEINYVPRETKNKNTKH